MEGTPVAWSAQEVLFLERNGVMQQFSAGLAREYHQTSVRFQPFTQSQMRGVLLREFGRNFECSGTGHYLVVHPAGQRDLWANRFENLYRSFSHYFVARGFNTSQPVFPLVAVALPTREAFAQYAQRQGGPTDPRVLGFYSPRSNRIVLYDVTRGRADDESWYVNAETIIHEATHQIAFNTGIHSRYANPPRWLAEGLAMMFEAPGVWDPRHFPNREDRINKARLGRFRKFLSAELNPGSLRLMIGNPDTFFRHAPGVAYAEAWAFTFFLSEQEPSRLMRFFAVTADREPLRKYGEQERVKEFTQIFGDNFAQLESRLVRFVSALSPARP